MINQTQKPKTGDRALPSFVEASDRGCGGARATKLSVTWAALFITMLSVFGCQSPWRSEPEYREPALSMNITRDELVQHLNSQRHGLEGWRSASTVMWVNMPRMPPVRLEGVIACQAPQYFRLTADTLIAEADLGSNASRCWAYFRPGPAEIQTWRHEDTKLLHHLPTELPYIDPNWLMMMLGIRPLNPADYDLGRDPGGSQELWLTAVEDIADSRPLRRVIKVDAVHGVAREHAVYGDSTTPVMRALVSRHRNHDGHLIPTQIKLEFPQKGAEISLTFRSIEANPHLPDDLWTMPERNLRQLDIGAIAQQFAMRRSGGLNSDRAHQLPGIHLGQPEFRSPNKSAMVPGTRSENSFISPDFDEPDWDTPTSQVRQISISEPEFEDGPEFGEQPARTDIPFWKRLLPFGRR